MQENFYETCNATVRDAMGENVVTSDTVNVDGLDWESLCDGHIMSFFAGKVVAEITAIALTEESANATGLPKDTVCYWLDVTEHDTCEFYTIRDDTPDDVIESTRHTFHGIDTAKKVWAALAGLYEIDAP